MTGYLILLPVAAYALLTLTFRGLMPNRGLTEAFVRSHVVIFFFIAISTEIASMANAINFDVILTIWIVAVLVCAAAAFRSPSNANHQLTGRYNPRDFLATAVVALAILLISTFATSLLYPPNTADSLIYHMARIAHWIADKNVSFYPTPTDRQLYQPPLAEYAIMHIQILTGGDTYANLIQWVSYVVDIGLGFLIAGEIGLDVRSRVISALVVATLPMAVLQASSTQNDLVASSFILSFALFMMRLRHRLNWENVLFSALSLGLALLTKGTAFIYCAPLGIFLSFPVLRAHLKPKNEAARAVAYLALIVVIALLIPSGHFWRSYEHYGTPLSSGEDHYFNEDMSAKIFMSNVLRNVASHLSTPSEKFNKSEARLLNDFLGPEINNRKTTWKNFSFRIPYSRHEDTAGNLIHMLAVLLTIVILPLLWLKGRHRQALPYAFGVLGGALLYCILLKWQPFASRLHTPLFALSAPLIAASVMPEGRKWGNSVGYVMIALMFLYSLPFAFSNDTRPLFPPKWHNRNRLALYFPHSPEYYRDVKSAIDMLSKRAPGQVGLYLARNDLEYPYWAFSANTAVGGITSFKHVGVDNASGVTDIAGSLPSYVIATRALDTWKYAARYRLIYKSTHVRVLRLVGTGKSAQ